MPTRAELMSWISDRAYTCLARRDYARAELGLKLRTALKRQHEEVEDGEALVEEVLDLLTARGHLTEERFVEAWIENRLSHKPRGRYMILQELLHKGVPHELIEQYLDKMLPLEAEIALARHLLAKKTASQKDRRKLAAFLQSKGFSYAIVRRVLSLSPDEDEQSVLEEI